MERKAQWEKRAICLGRDPELFFPVRVNLYEKTCIGCPVINQCKSYAIVHDEEGIWGGTTYRQRKALGELLAETLRGLYYDAGLLEYRPGPVAEFIQRRRNAAQNQSHDTALHSSVTTLAG